MAGGRVGPQPAAHLDDHRPLLRMGDLDLLARRGDHGRALALAHDAAHGEAAGSRSGTRSSSQWIAVASGRSSTCGPRASVK